MDWYNDRQMKSQLIVLIIVLLFTVLLKLPTLGINHNEGDEQIYLSLAKNLYNNGDYSLQGTEILRHLPPEIYNKPFFHHPPAYLFMMFPFMYVLGDNYAVIVSWVGHLLLIVAVFMLVLKHIDKQKKWLLPVILLMVAFDPLMIFTSQKIWFDSCMVGFFAFSIALLYEGLFAARLGIRRSLFALSGLFFALAVLMKILVGALAPLFSLIFWQHGYFKDINRGKILDALCLLIPSLVLLLPWFIKFYSVYGVLTPYWLNEPTNQALTNRFIAIVAARPWYYYIKELVLIYPAMSLMVFLVIVKRGKKIFEMSTYQVAMIFWFVSFFAFMTYISIGRVWLMRYMVLCLPPMYILPAINCKEEADEKKGNPLYAALLASWLAINCLSSVFYMVMYNYADMLSLAESIKGLL